MFPFYIMAGGLKADVLMRRGRSRAEALDQPGLIQATELAESVVTSDLLAKGALGIKEPDAISIFARRQVGDVLGRPVDAQVDP